MMLNIEEIIQSKRFWDTDQYSDGWTGCIKKHKSLYMHRNNENVYKTTNNEVFKKTFEGE